VISIVEGQLIIEPLLAGLAWGAIFGVVGFAVGAFQSLPQGPALATSEISESRWGKAGRVAYLLVAGSLLGCICVHLVAVFWVGLFFWRKVGILTAKVSARHSKKLALLIGFARC